MRIWSEDGRNQQKEKVVCIWVDKGEEGEKGERIFEWFVIQDLDSIESDELTTEFRTQVFKTQGKRMDSWPNADPSIRFPTPIALNNSIYYIGGRCDSSNTYRHRYSNTVTCFDTTKRPIELISVSPMNAPRDVVVALAHNGRIFAFREGAEVFSVKDGSWRPFSGPKDDPQTNCATPPALSDPVNNRIILYFRRLNSLYAYYPPKGDDCDYDKEDRWECITSNFDLQWLGSCALVDDFIITYHICPPNFFSAYDLVNRKSSPLVWLDNKILDHAPLFGDDLRPWSYQGLLHLGHGKLCMLRSYPRNRNYLAVDCFTFTVKNIQGVITASAPVVKSFHLEGRGCYPADYLLF